MEIITTLLTSLLYILKEVGVFGLLLICFIIAIIVITKYFADQEEKLEKFFLGEKKKFEDQQKLDAKSIADLTITLNMIRDENMKKLEEANSNLMAVNELLRRKIYGE